MHPDRKAAHELAVFREFIACVLSEESDCAATSRTPPEPDIRFESKSGPRYYELGRLADAEVARTTLEAMRNAPAQVVPDMSKVGLPERDVLAGKLLKTYRSDGLPIELLLYFDADRDQSHLAGGIPTMNFADHAVAVMLPLLVQSMGAFRRVWVFERYRRTVLWSYPHPRESCA